MCVRLSSSLGVVEYSLDRMPKKNAPAISWPMDVFRCVSVHLYICRTIFDGIAFCCLVVGSSVLWPLSCRCRIKDFWPEDSRVGSFRRCVRKDADTSDMADLTVPWRIICFLVFLTSFVALRRKMMTHGLYSALVGSLPGVCLWSLSVWGMLPTYPIFQTS